MNNCTGPGGRFVGLFGVDPDLGLGVAIVVMILIIMAIDLAVLYGSERVANYLSHATVELLERVLGLLLGALAVELIITGINSTGIFAELLK